jgi:hypothetical protein
MTSCIGLGAVASILAWSYDVFISAFVNEHWLYEAKIKTRTSKVEVQVGGVEG